MAAPCRGARRRSSPLLGLPPEWTAEAAFLRFVQAHTPIRRLVSRHTRALLRRYFKAGTLTTPIADRSVVDRFIDMTPEARALYSAVEEYIASTYNQAGAAERTAVGFVMAIYRRRLASGALVAGESVVQRTGVRGRHG